MSDTATNKCDACGADAGKRCNQCKSVWYCSRDCQVNSWKGHKAKCKAIANDQMMADSHELHKKEFDRIRVKYGLSSPEQAEKISEMLSTAGANGG